METETKTLNEEEQATWRTVLRAQANITSAVDKKLMEDHKLGLSDYDVLNFLSEAPSNSVRMIELAHGVLLSPSGLTRRLDGLVKQGLVERQPAPSDGRGLLAVLTEAGKTKVRDMEPSYSSCMREHFIDLLEPQQIKEIYALFEPIASNESDCATA